MTLFGSRFAGLKLAAIGMAAIAAMPDATADQVKLSRDEYRRAANALSPFKRILDAYLLQWFLPDNVVRTLPRGSSAADLMLEFIKSKEAERFFNSKRGRETDAAIDRLAGRDRTLAELILSAAEQRRFFHWELEFPEAFYTPRPDAEQHVEMMPNPGFDAVVGNPPYDVLSELENDVDLSGLEDFFDSAPTYQPALMGKNNLYKLFVCRSQTLAKDAGLIGMIVPMGILGNDQMVGLRRLFLQTGRLRSVDAFPQKDDPERRVFREAKLATCVFVYERLASSGSNDQPFVARQHPADQIDPTSPSVQLLGEDLEKYDPVNIAIVTASQTDWDLAVRIVNSHAIQKLGSVCRWYQGEINETVARQKGFLADSSANEVVRGAAVCLYAIRAASQGEDLFLNKQRYLRDANPGSKAFHHLHPRVVMQNAAPQNNFRRLIGAPLSAGHFCSYKLNYTIPPACSVQLAFVMALVNSKLADWFFRLGSASADVNHYQLDNLPCPRFCDLDPDDDRRASAFIEKALKPVGKLAIYQRHDERQLDRTSGWNGV
ncbi:MAG TPA: Eco57I restriction-modification methylase domain-containing protein, partial [Tepidisphaeraceae bacterium]